MTKFDFSVPKFYRTRAGKKVVAWCVKELDYSLCCVRSVPADGEYNQGVWLTKDGKFIVEDGTFLHDIISEWKDPVEIVRYGVVHVDSGDLCVLCVTKEAAKSWMPIHPGKYAIIELKGVYQP